MTAPDLLPCPFCGAGIAKTVGNASFSGVELMGAGTDRPYVWCGTCGSAGSFEDSDDKAIAAWNTRATPAAMTPEVRALVEAAEPLAAMASRYDPEDGDGDLECWFGLAVPKIKHIRALRSALAALREGGGA